MSSFGVELLEVFQRSFSQEADLHFIKFSNKRSRRKPERDTVSERKRGIVWKTNQDDTSVCLELSLFRMPLLTPVYPLL